LEAGDAQRVTVAVNETLEHDQYVFFCLMANPHVAVHTSELRVTGLLTVNNRFDAKVATGAKQAPPEDIGVETFEFWTPQRRPKGHNLALEIEPPLAAFESPNVVNGVQRPTTGTNAWVASPNDAAPALMLEWLDAQTIARIELFFDPDYDHAMESVLMGHPERAMPFCVRSYRIVDADTEITLHEEALNHQARRGVQLAQPVTTRQLRIEVRETWGAPAAIFEVRCYAPDNGIKVL
jgi:hypothetical protein